MLKDTKYLNISGMVISLEFFILATISILDGRLVPLNIFLAFGQGVLFIANTIMLVKYNFMEE